MKKYFIILISVLTLVSCEDFFDKEPLGNPNLDDFYTNVNHAQLGLNAVYQIVTSSSFQKSTWLFGEGCGDDVSRIVDLEVSTAEAQLMQFDFSNDNKFINTLWSDNYKGIYRANWVINKSPDIEVVVDQARIDLQQIIGQAKFFRAYFYFNLVKSFGGVPIRPEILYMNGTGDDNFVQPRNSVEEVYDYIERDLREASIILFQEYTRANNNDELGKVDRAAALALLTKVLAYQAEIGLSDPKWEEVKSLGAVLVDNDELLQKDILKFGELYTDDDVDDLVYRLQLDTLDLNQKISVPQKNLASAYDQIWHLNGEFGSESNFEINFTLVPGASLDVKSAWNTNLSSDGKVGPKNIQPTREMQDLITKTSDRRIMSTIFSQGDQHPTFSGNGSQKVGQTSQPENTACFKWANVGDENKAEKNLRLIRHAEVMLFYAEALNETGDPQSAIDIVNQLTQRGRSIDMSLYGNQGSPELPVNRILGSFEQVQKTIWEERHVEFCFEFDRFYDIVRTNQIESQMEIYNKNRQPEYRKNFVKGVNEIFPIPQEEIDLSGGVVAQNPGY